MCEQGCQSPTALGCLNGGSCVADDRKQTFSCLFKAPWSGKNCDIKLDKKMFKDLQCCNCNDLYSRSQKSKSKIAV